MFIKRRIGERNKRQSVLTHIADAMPKSTVPPTAFFMFLVSFAPKKVAIIRAKPLVKPFSRPVSMSLKMVVEPTAASASSPSVEPTMRVSTRL